MQKKMKRKKILKLRGYLLFLVFFYKALWGYTKYLGKRND